MIQLNQLDNNYISVMTENIEILKKIDKYFAVPVPGAKFSLKVKAKQWNGIQNFFSMHSRKLPVGLISELLIFFKQNKLDYELEGDWNMLGYTFTDDEVRGFYKAISSEEYEPFDHQIEAFKKCMKKKRLIAKLPTGAGKSYLIYGIIRYLLEKGKKLLLIVPTTSLVEQMYTDFEEYGWLNIAEKCEKLYAKVKPTFKLPVLISTWQSLQKKEDHFFADYDGIIVDECHSSQAQQLQKIMKLCINADWRIGTTGTVQVDQYNRFKVYSWLGPEVAPITTVQLIEKDLLSKLKINIMMLNYPEAIRKKNYSRLYPDEMRFIESYTNRNQVFNKIFEKVKPESNSLVLVSHIQHLKDLQAYFISQKLGKKVHIVQGSVDATEREAIRNLTELTQGNIIIATYQTFSTGINIKNLHHIILAATTKSQIRLIQSIGRGLRKHDSKELLNVWDIVDCIWHKPRKEIKYNYAMKHSGERNTIYKQQGFQVEQFELDV